ncbi:MAG: NAD(P)H-hydrate epimerase [Gemmobacter sp.]
MRAIEAAAIASGAVSGRALMERAGAGVVAAMLDLWPDLAAKPGRAMVLCGPGNNGGDGFVIARLLAQRGWQATVLMLGDPARLPPDAAAARRDWAAIGPTRALAAGADPGPADLGPGDVVIDALYGIGLSRPARDAAHLFARFMREARPWRVVAVDVPSGIDADTGAPPGGGPAPHAAADLTVTFHRPKPGHVAGAGRPPFGTVRVVDIGLPDGAT